MIKTLGVIGIAGTLVLAASGLARADMGGGFGPGMGMMGHGMMEHGWSAPPGESGWHTMGFAISGLTLTKEQAGQIAQAHLQALGNPNLKLGEVNEVESSFEVPFVTKDGSFVERLLVDKRTGWLRSVY